MKKIFSLLCATLLVFSASAAPVAQKAELVKKAPATVEQMQSVQFEKAQTLNLNQLSATPALTVSNQKATAPVVKANSQKVAKASKQMVRRSAANAKKVAKAPQNTAITIGTFSPATYEGEYYVTLTDANSTTQFYFDFDTSVNPFEVGKTYTLDEMIADYVAMGDADDWYAWEPATAATYTETVDEKGLTHIAASMTTESGTYDITYDQPEPQDVDVTAVDWYYDSEYYDVYVYSETTTYLFELKEDLEYGKAYTYADMVPSWTCTLTSGGYPDITATDATLTVTKDEAGLIHIAATMVLSGNKHIIAYDEKAFEPTGKQIEVNGTDLNGRYMSAYGFYLYTATWGDYTVQLAFDAEEEKASYTNEEFIANYGLIYSDSEQIQLLKLASDNITITTTETTKTLAGSVYAKNGDEYVLNLVYEKPDAKEISINVKDATLNNKSVAGFWTIGGQTEDKIYDCNIYFISKALQGTFTDVELFDAYSTWVSDKSSGSNVYYENLSEVNLISAIVADSLVIEGTLNLADANGNPAIVTVHISTPFTKTWGEWEDFAPFDKNTGKYTFATFGAYTQTGIQVQVRKDNTGLKQYKLKSWSKGYFDGVGQDLVLNMNPDYTFTFASNPINLGADVYFADVATAFSNPAYASYNSYDPETGVFSFYTAVVFADDGSVYTAAKESLVMDRPITERDTVDIVSTALKYNDLIASNKVVIYYAADVPDYYLFRVTSNNATSVDGTFKWSDGTINDPNSYFSVTGEDKNYFQDGEFTVVTNNKDIALTGWMIGVDEKYYRLNMSYTAPTTRDTVRFSGNGVTISECVNSQTGVQTGWFYEVADASTGYEFLLQSTVVANKYGTFSYEDKTLGSNYYNVFDPQGNRQQFVEGSITVGEVGDSLILDGELIAEDEKVYILHFAQSNKVLNYDTDAPFDATFGYGDMSTDLDEGVISIHATNAENLTIGLELYADPAATTIPAGTYVISDTQEAGTALQSLGVVGGYLTECWAGVRAASGGIADCWFLVEGTITLSYDEYGKLKVVVDAKNSYGQPVTALVQYVKIDPKSSVDIADADFTVYEGYLEKYGIMNFYGGNAEGYEFDLYAYADTYAGDFLEAIDFGDCEIYLTDGSSVGVMDAYEFKIEAEGKNLTLTAKVLGTDTIQYNITATGFYGFIDGDATVDYLGEFANKDVTITQIDKSNVMMNARNAAGDTIAIAFKAKLSKGVLPVGEYTEIFASTGWSEEEQVVPSFVTSADNVDWFIQSGTLTVNADGTMSFVGLNSYDKNVYITIHAAVTDINNANAAKKTIKSIKNGMIVIEKNGKAYNVLGVAL